MDDLKRIQDKLKKRNESSKKKKKISDLDKYLVFCFVVIILYTVTAIIFQWVTDMELSTSLTVGVYGFFGGEITLLAMIKRLKLKKEDNYEQ